MKKCIVYGNCQRDLLERYLLKSNFSKHYQIIPTLPVPWKNKKNLDPETLSSVDLIIYQKVSDTFGHDFSSEAILSQLKPSCEKILFPSIFFNCYWPQYTRQPVIRRLHKFTIASGGLIPHGDSNIIRLMQAGTSLEDIINILSDEDFYSESEVMKNINKSFQELSMREKDNNVDIKLSDYIYNNLKDAYLMHTINHPSCFVGMYVAEQILKILGISHTKFDIEAEYKLESQTKGYEAPIYPSVIRRLGLTFIDKHYRYNFYFKNKLCFERYIDYYYKHSIGMDIIEGKNQDAFYETNSPVKLLDCPATQKYFEQNRESLRQNVITLNDTISTINNNIISLMDDTNISKKTDYINKTITKIEPNIDKVNANVKELIDIVSQLSEAIKNTVKASTKQEDKRIEPCWSYNVILFGKHAFLPTIKDLRRVHSRDFSAVISLLTKRTPSPETKKIGTALASHCSKSLAAAYILENSGGIWNSKLGFMDKIREFLILRLRQKEIKRYTNV